MNPNAYSQQGISPAMLSAFQNQQKSAFPGSMGNGSINPSQLMNGAGGGSGGVNPAALSAPPQQGGSLNLQNLLSALGMSREQFQALPNNEKQNLGQKYMQMVAQQQQMMMNMQNQHQQQQAQTYERPSSSASTHSSHQPGQSQMMPPPPPRPPTAQGGQHISRPGTSLSHRSPTIPGPGLGSMMDAQLAQRPQSRMSHPDPMMNGFKQGQTQQGAQQFNNPSGGPSTPNHGQQIHQPNPHQQQGMQQTMHLGQGNPYPQPPPPSTSPTRGAKRKVADMNMGMGGGPQNMMGGMMGNGMGGGMNPMGGGGGGGGMPNNLVGNMNMSNMGMNMGNNSNPMANMGMNMNMMTNTANMNSMSGMGGIPGSPRIGGVGGPPSSMGPPGLPRSMSSDGMGGGGMMNNANMSMAMGNNNMNMANMGMTNANSNNMGMNMNNPMNMNMSNMMSNANNNNNAMGMMNGVGGARGSPRPQSAMGMSGPLGMNMNMGMNVDSPSITATSLSRGGMMGSQQGGQNPGQGGTISLGPAPGSGPQTPMRQGSLPPQTPISGSGGGVGPMGMQGMGGHQGLQTPMRQGSLPPGGGSGQPQQGMPQMGRRTSVPPPQGMVMNNMNMGGMGGGMQPHPMPASPMSGSSSGMGGGLGGLGGPQAMPMAPSISATSSMGSMSGLGGVPNPAAAVAAAASGAGLIAPSTSLGGNPTPSGTSTPSGAISGSGSTPTPLGASTSVGPPGIPTAPAPTANNSSGSSSTNSGLAPPPPLPSAAAAALHPKMTLITPVPLLTSLTTIPALSSDEIENVKEWLEIDRAYDAKVQAMKIRGREESKAAFGGVVPGPSAGPSVTGAGAGGTGIKWWERGAPGNGMANWSRFRRAGPGVVERFDIRYPPKRRDVYGHTSVGHGRNGRKEKRREGLKLPRKIDPEDANRPEMLVPIRIEFDVEHHKMRDAFVWNLNDPVVSPEAFAQSIVDDYALAPSYHSIIVKSIQDQLSDYKAHSLKYDADLNELSDTDEVGPVHGALDANGDEERWWAGWRKRVVKESTKAVKEAQAISGAGKEKKGKSRKKRKVVQVKYEGGDDVNMLADDEFATNGQDEDDVENDEELFKPLSVDEFKLDQEAMQDDMRILIKLDIIIGSIKLDDQFEWDLDNPMASPEEFAEVYTQELGLGGEFKTAIAHSIREQVQTYQKSLFLIGHHPTDAAVQDDDLKSSFLPYLVSGARPVGEVQMFTPLLNYLSDGELERTEKERDKDLTKRRKRNTRGRRGITMPDREPIRTYRTPAIGFPELDAATLALAAAANAPMSRRAAAAAASLTIANMVASENGTPFMPQTIQSTAPQPPPPTAAQKDKKPKGLFKAPSCPPAVLRPRAQVVAPTPSTAADVAGMPSVPADSEAPRSSSSIAPPPLDPRASKLMTVKRQKELEREAKEKEFVDGQHPNYIDGVWHCSNCGCPESIAIGRRKGPLGDKSQCGTCGKFWHRHRRPRPVEYNPDPAHHSGIKQKETDSQRTPANKKKGAAAALRAQSAANSATPAADTSEPQTPAKSNGDVDASSRKSPALKDDDDRAISPVSSASSASEAPLAQKVKLNGSHSKTSSTPVPATPAKIESTKSGSTSDAAAVASASTTAPSGGPSSPGKAWPPAWLSEQMHQMQTKYPNDRFDVILRKVNAASTGEWRIKCLDCPGKLYTPGPGETLSNYEVHLKNRQHRQRVNDRVAGVPASST